MCLWKFRVDIPGDPPDITVVTSVLARYPARLLNMSMDTGCHSATGEFVVDLPHAEGVGPILSALHDISPTVLIGREKSCVTSRSGAATTAAVTSIASAGDRRAFGDRRASGDLHISGDLRTSSDLRASGFRRRVSRIRHAERLG